MNIPFVQYAPCVNPRPSAYLKTAVLMMSRVAANPIGTKNKAMTHKDSVRTAQ